MTLFEFDRTHQSTLLCGVDEAGRGPLAGDVYAAAVILPLDCVLDGLDDSKKLTPKKRERLYDEVIRQAVSYEIASATVQEIEKYNILQATHLAMLRAVQGLTIKPTLVLVDGNRAPQFGIHTKCIVKGDAASASIAAASILAKVARDRHMCELAQQYPLYGFEKHKGYGTKQHFEKIDQYGMTPIHRPSFLTKYHAGKNAEVSHTKKTGQAGEDLACKYLQKQGYEIITRNYRTEAGEIDIIAQKDGFLSFIEVKTRAEHTIYAAQDAVTHQKQEKIKQTAQYFLMDHPCDLQPRFDVCEVYLTNDQRVFVRLLEHAFI